MTPLMTPRRDTDGDVSSGIFLSSIAGSPRRVGIDRMERDLIPATIIRYASQINGLSSLPDVYECLAPDPAPPHDLSFRMHLTFLGAAGTVTGSKHLLGVDGRRILVDCGLFQGLNELRLRNWEPLPVDPASIDAVVLTHAHLDHCGYLPRLVAGGYRGRIFCTPATKKLCSLVLPDAAKIQEEKTPDANRPATTRHNPALPLFTTNDAARALDRLQPVGYERPMPLVAGGGQTRVRPGSDPGLAPTVEFLNAGHLLGSAYARIQVGERTLLFGGDLGRYGRPVLPDPSTVSAADILLVESTYGDRLHEPDDNGARLASIVNEAAGRGGKLIVPSFAVGRVEEVLYWLKRLEDDKRIPIFPVFFDRPVGV